MSAQVVCTPSLPAGKPRSMPKSTLTGTPTLHHARLCSRCAHRDFVLVSGSAGETALELLVTE